MKRYVTLISAVIVCLASNLAESRPPDNNQAIVIEHKIKTPTMTYEDSEYMEFINSSGETIAFLNWGDGELRFSGNATPAAKTFFEKYVKPIVDEYIKNHCGGKI